MVFRTHGGDKRDRTADLLNAIQALSQLSYTPIRYSDLFPGQLLYYNIHSETVNIFFFFFSIFLHLNLQRRAFSPDYLFLQPLG